MERYSKTSSSKWQSKYSEGFKLFVCNEFLTGTLTRRELDRKYCIGNYKLTFNSDYTKASLYFFRRKPNRL